MRFGLFILYLSSLMRTDVNKFNIVFKNISNHTNNHYAGYVDF